MLDVILCAYNAEKTIDECVSSILNQTFKDFNLFILNDASTDKTLDKLKSFKDSKLTIIDCKQNIGTYAGKNLIFKNFCKAEFVALHDADDYSNLSRFEKQIEYLQKNKHCAIVGCSIREFSEDNTTFHTTSNSSYSNGSRINKYPTVLRKTNIDEAIFFLDNKNLYKYYTQYKFCMNGAIMMRADVIQSIGGWDGTARVAADTDLFVRVLVNHEIHNVKEVLYNRRFHKASLTASDEFGINSEQRKQYNMTRLHVVRNAYEGTTTMCDFLYPPVAYEVIT